MKNREYTILFLSFVVLFAISSCKDNKGKNWYFDKQESTSVYDENPISGDTTVVREQKEVGDFVEVEISDASNVTLHIGPKCKVLVNGEKAYVDAQKTEVEDGKLKINFKDEMSHHHKTNIDIYAPRLDAVRLHNVQNMVFDGQDNVVDEFDISLKRVVMAHFNSLVKAGEIDVKIDGMTYGNFYFETRELEWQSKHITHAKIVGQIGKLELEEDRKGSVEIVKPKE